MATLTQAQMTMYAQAAGLPDPAVWAAIGMAESSGSTTIVNSIGCVGWLQINQPVWVKSHPSWSVAWLQNPANNASAAKVVFDAQGYGAWQGYTGPDGKGSDGPWRQYYKGSATATDAGFNPVDPFGLLPGNNSVITNPLDALSSVEDDLKKTADVLVNPRTWLRLGYGAMGSLLIVGGLFLIVSNTSAGKGVMKAASNIKVIPV